MGGASELRGQSAKTGVWVLFWRLRQEAEDVTWDDWEEMGRKHKEHLGGVVGGGSGSWGPGGPSWAAQGVAMLPASQRPACCWQV